MPRVYYHDRNPKNHRWDSWVSDNIVEPGTYEEYKQHTIYTSSKWDDIRKTYDDYYKKQREKLNKNKTRTKKKQSIFLVPDELLTALNKFGISYEELYTINLKKHWKMLQLKNHPDKNRNVPTSVIQDINNAYLLLQRYLSFHKTV